MPKLLVIEVSPRGPASASRQLTERFVEKWRADHEGGDIIVRDLAASHVPYVNLPWIGGAFAPAEYQTPEMKEAIKVSDDYIAELMAADEVVIGAPMYNFSIPAILKAYIDHVVRFGVTFTADYQGLVVGKKATVIIASGGDFGPGTPYEAANVESSYLRQILGFIGITDVNVMLAGRTLAVDRGEKTMSEFVGQFDGELSIAAAA